MKAKKAEVPSLETLEQYRLQVRGDDAEKRAARAAIDGVARSGSGG